MMSAGGRFTQFGRLPTEIRLKVWEHHFQTPHVHTIRDFQGPVDDPEDASSLYENTTTVLTKASIANFEAGEAARLAEKRRMHVALGKDVTQRVLRRGQDPEYHGYAASVFPALVNWDTDLIYLYLPSLLSALPLAYDQPWAGKIQHLAIHFSDLRIGYLAFRLRSTRAQRFWDNAEERLARFVAITELVLVRDPSRRSEGNWRQKPRDAYGFIPFDHEFEDKLVTGMNVEFQLIVKMFWDIISRLERKTTIRTAIAMRE